MTTPAGRNRSVLNQTRFLGATRVEKLRVTRVLGSNRDKASRLVLVESPLEIPCLVEGAYVVVQLGSRLLRDAGLDLRRG
jgi:hypothetical protein